MNTLQDFFDNAKERNLCERGAKIWEHCQSKKALMDFCLGSWGMNYVATAICQGWAIDPEVIKEEFAPFINGKYVRDKDGYTSAIYCCTDDDIVIKTTSALIIKCGGNINIEKHVCELQIVNSCVEISGEGHAIAYLYNSTIKNCATANVIIKKDENYGTA